MTTITKDEATKAIREALGLMNCMIACGESHSVTSTDALERAYRACDALAAIQASGEPFGYFVIDSLDIPYPGSGFVRQKPKDGDYEVVTPLYTAAPAPVQAQPVASEWKSITAPGQVKVGTRLRFTIGDDKYSETAKLILHPGTDAEEIIYNKRKNYYLITSMAIVNLGSQKNVEYLATPAAVPAEPSDPVTRVMQAVMDAPKNIAARVDNSPKGNMASEFPAAPSMGNPIPPNIYFRNRNFYCADDARGMGNEFYVQWIERCAEFPTSAADATVPAELSDAEKFRAHLQRASEEVVTWPVWKRMALTPPSGTTGDKLRETLLRAADILDGLDYEDTAGDLRDIARGAA
jgi:hypothetical protein